MASTDPDYIESDEPSDPDDDERDDEVIIIFYVDYSVENLL